MTIEIAGMHCDACVRRVMKALESAAGVTVQGVRVGSAEILGDQNAAREAIRKAGYEPRADA